ETGDGELDPDEQPGTRGQRNEAREAEDAEQYVHILEKLSLVRGEWVVGCPYPGDPGQWWLFTQDSAHKPGGLNLLIAQVSGVHHGRKCANLIGEGKQGDGAGCARASRPTGAVDECLGVPRGVDVHDGTNPRHIDTPGCDVGGDKHAHLTLPEVRECSLAGQMAAIAMQCGDLDSARREVFRPARHRMSSAHEDDHAAHRARDPADRTLTLGVISNLAAEELHRGGQFLGGAWS